MPNNTEARITWALKMFQKWDEGERVLPGILQRPKEPCLEAVTSFRYFPRLDFISFQPRLAFLTNLIRGQILQLPVLWILYPTSCHSNSLSGCHEATGHYLALVFTTKLEGGRTSRIRQINTHDIV